jgi:tRNA modification GTPase
VIPRSAEDTIAAIATAPGRAALAIVRVSGPRSHEIGKRLIRPWPDRIRRATLSRVHDASGELLDEAIVVVHASQASFTGEDTVEVTSHGGPILPASILAAFVAEGARPADPGEFTRRAVLNGKIDLLQAEAVGDLVDSSTRQAQRVALRQLDGGLSRRIAALREDILQLEALAAYDIDFPEEDDGPIAPARVASAAEAIVDALDQLLATAPMGELVRHGALVVIAGAPNVGKSSLFNAMLGRRRAIVTDIPGTTRDALEAVTEARGWPIRLVDTAGLRDAAETVERIGIEVSREYLERADVVLACGDSERAVSAARDTAAAITPVPAIDVRTKADLASATERASRNGGSVYVSAETGEGLRDLAAAIARTLESAKGTLSLDAPLVTRERQRLALTRARSELEEFREAWVKKSVPTVVAAVHLREATRELEELIGAVDVEDVLDRVFASFCVGK